MGLMRKDWRLSFFQREILYCRWRYRGSDSQNNMTVTRGRVTRKKHFYLLSLGSFCMWLSTLCHSTENLPAFHISCKHVRGNKTSLCSCSKRDKVLLQSWYKLTVLKQEFGILPMRATNRIRKAQVLFLGSPAHRCPTLNKMTGRKFRNKASMFCIIICRMAPRLSSDRYSL